MEIDRSKPVLVTGANGFIASWIVKYLLEDGITVHGTVRDPNNDKKVGHLKKIAAESPGELKLFAADLLDQSAFDAPMAGCELVMHTASPFVVQGIKDPQKELVDPALKGTEAVLNACNRVDSVKRVVLTASVAAVYGDNIDMQEQGVEEFNESHWNQSSSLNHQPYSYSKTVAEKLAWDIVGKQDRWDLLTINPTLVLGPSLTNATASGSVDLVKQLVDGRMRTGAPALQFGIVDVRDVAIAHINAGFMSAASGRHITDSEAMTLLEIAELWKTEFGNHWPFPIMQAPKAVVWLIGPLQGVDRSFVKRNVGYPIRISHARAEQDLNMKFRPAKETLIAHFEQMLDDGVIPDKRK